MINVYDNEHFFNEYKTMREQEINANNLIEIPIMKEMLPDVKGKRILDLGCGGGAMSKYFVENGAEYVLGIDCSQNMINFANAECKSSRNEFRILPMEEIDRIEEKFDIVYSSLAFHYVKDFNVLLKNIYNLLNDKGILIYSQESPIVTSIILQNKDQSKKILIGDKMYFLTSDYCNEGERNNVWNDVSVTKYHRTYATIVNSLVKNKFNILEMKDSYASEEAIKLCDKYKYQKDKPYFTFVMAQKNN